MTDKQYKEMYELMLSFGNKALTMSHYDFAQKTKIKDTALWREFILDPQTSDWMEGEMNLIRTTQMRGIQMNAADSTSVGQAQLLNALAGQAEKSNTKDGPAFIFCHVPLNANQKKSPSAKLIESYIKEEL